MFFLLSKFISMFIKPIVIIALSLLAAILIKNPKYKKRLLWLSFGILMVFGNRFISTQLLQSLEYDPVEFKDLGQYQFGIVLTGITDPTMQPRDRVYINYGADRVFHTIQLYRMGIIRKILITGNNALYPGNPLTEAGELREVFLLSRIPVKDIVLEERAKNTKENASFSKKALDSLGVISKSLLITSAFHMRRAALSFNKAGVQFDVFPTNFYGNQPHYNFETLVLPSEDALGTWVLLIHEMVGELVYRIMGYA